MVRFSFTPHISPRTKSTCTNESWNLDMTFKLKWSFEIWLDEQLDCSKIAVNFTKKNPCTHNTTLCTKKREGWVRKWYYVLKKFKSQQYKCLQSNFLLAYIQICTCELQPDN